MPSSYDELDVKVYVDYPQNRSNIKSPFVYAADGTSWDTSTAINCYIEPVSRTVIGMPVPMTPEWRTTFTGQGYTRLQKADFTFTSPSSWGNIFFYGTNDTYLFCASNITGTMNAPVQLNGGVTRNQPLFFSFIKQNKKESNTNITAKLFWSGNSFVNKDTQLHFKDDGSCDIYRGYQISASSILCTTSSAVVTGVGTTFTALVGTPTLYTEDGRTIGTVSTISSDTSLTLTAIPTFNYAGLWHIKVPQKVATYSRNENNYNQQAVSIRNNNPNNDYNDVYIMPMRGKELIINTSYGLNFSHTFDDLIETNDINSVYGPYYGYNTGITTTPVEKFLLPEILPTGAFSIVIPNGKCAFQLAKLFFLSNWTIGTKRIYNEVAQQGFSNIGYRSVSPEVGQINSSTYSSTVTGFLTAFTSAWIGGRLFGTNPDGTKAYEVGTISAVASTTSLTLSSISTIYNLLSSFSVMLKKTGTIVANTSSNIITGTGTLFLTQVAVNDDVYDPNDYYLGKVQSISSNTSMTLYYNSLTDCTSTAYWLNYPIIDEIFQNNNAEIMGPANSTQITDIPVPSGQFYYNASTTATLSSSDNAVVYISSSSTSEPNNLLKNNDSTHCLYSFDAIITWVNQKTKTTTVDITNVIEHLVIKKTEEGENGCSLSARKQNLIDVGMVNPERISNRPIKITLKPRNLAYGEVTIFEGYLKNPDIEYIQGPNYDKYALLTFEAYDKKQLLNEVYFTKAPSFDNITLFQAMQQLIRYGGGYTRLTSYEYAFGFLAFYFGLNRNNSNGQYNWTANIEDSVGSFIEKIRSELAQNIAFKYGFDWNWIAPLNKWINNEEYSFIDQSVIQENVGGIFTVPLYLSDANATTFGSVPASKTYKRTLRNLKRTYELPEANQVIVIGNDKTNNDRIVAIVDDINSQNPFITNRPDNWLGMVKTFCSQNERFTNKNIVQKSAQSFFNKISTGREIVEFQSDFITYFDDFSKATNMEPLPAKTGTIDSFTYSNVVSGVGTLFTSELIAGNILYSADGYMIGTVASIGSNTSLTLTTNALYAVSTGQYFLRNPIKWLYEYRFLSTGNLVELFDTTGVSTGKYRILSYEVEFVKNNIPVYISGILQNPETINIAQCNYKAVKQNIINRWQIIEKEQVNTTFENDINVLKSTASKIVLSFITGGAGLTYSTSGAPAGMTFSMSALSESQQDLVIDWTPSVGQTKQVFTFTVTVNNAGGIGNSYTIPLTFKVFDTL